MITLLADAAVAAATLICRGLAATRNLFRARTSPRSAAEHQPAGAAQPGNPPASAAGGTGGHPKPLIWGCDGCDLCREFTPAELGAD